MFNRKRTIPRSPSLPVAGLAALALACGGLWACGPDEKPKPPGFEVPDGGDNGGDGDKNPDTALVFGDWAYENGDIISVSEKRWESVQSVSKVVKVNAAEHYIIVQTAPPDSTYTKHVWTRFDDEQFYHCPVARISKLEDAEQSTRAKDSDLETGCGGGAWTLLSKSEPDVAIRGVWNDDFNSVRTISGKSWSLKQAGTTRSYEVVAFDNDARWLIRKEANTEQYSRILWTQLEQVELFDDGKDTVHYCEESGAESLEEAIENPIESDSEDLLSGCNGYPWPKLTRSF